jgi:prepilin-type N-terminal cleavage/methylation domain-containing protein
MGGALVLLGAAHRVDRRRAFTIVEILVVMAIILVLAGLVLATSSYVQNKGARSRAEAEIAAMSAALENYKADNGIYPRDANTDLLAAVTDQNFSTKNPPDPVPSSYNSDPGASNPDRPIYSNASFALYAQLSGNLNGDRSTVTQKTYFVFKPNMLYPAGGTGTVTAIVDPFGNSYGYSTAKVKYNENPGANLDHGFNPTYDLWSTAGTDTAVKSSYEQKWIKNW